MAAGTPPDHEQRLRDSRVARHRIQAHLTKYLVKEGDRFPHASPDYSNAYFRIGDVEKAWSGEDTIGRALYPNNLEPDEVICIQEKLLLFLSVLIWLNAHKQLDHFSSYVYGNDGFLLCANEKMPLQQHEMPNLGDPTIQQRFYHEQFMFSPVVIYESSEPTIIDVNRRLPFQEYTTTAEGAFGRVTKVTISPKYFVTEAGVKASENTVIAVKRFHVQNPSTIVDSRQEISNLSVLKESITKHRYIRTHLAALFHKGEHIILLPWADRYDLHHFLLEGHDLQGKQVYNFETVFDCYSQHFVRDTYKQISNIAAALKWLHEDVRPLNKRMYFAHMDLKPDNILIDNDSPQHPSSVGTWVLTDFGISAFKETDEKEDKDYVTVRDYVEQKQNLTLNTHARREAGAYQPPEVERLVQAADGSSNPLLQRVVGRRSDIWSFGCIFAEVVAFSSGRRAAVSDFREARRGTHNDDYFYTYQQFPSSNLSPGVPRHTPEPRPEMVAWLKSMADNLASPAGAPGIFQCSVAKVFDILKIDQRPGAEEVQKAMEHLTSHFNNDFRLGNNCAVRALPPTTQSALVPHLAADSPPTQTPPSQSPYAQPTPTQPSPPQGPTTIAQSLPQIIVRAHAADKGTVMHPGGIEVDETQSSNPPRESQAGHLPLTSDLGVAPPHRVESDELYTDPGFPITNTGTGGDNAVQPNQPQNQQGTSILSPRPSTTDSGYHSVLRTPGSAKVTYGVQTPGTKVKHIALCSSGRFVATITKPAWTLLKTPKYMICCHRISPTDLGVLELWSEPLPKAKSWDNVSLQSDLVVAWGDNTEGAKQVLLFRAKSKPPKMWEASGYPWLSTLRSVIVAGGERVLFVCNKEIFYLDLKCQDQSPQSLPDTTVGHAFKHAAVDNDIGILYAWSCGKEVEELKVWRLNDAHGRSIITFEGRQRYHTVGYSELGLIALIGVKRKYGDFNAVVLPYNGRKGCAIRLDGDEYLFTPAETSDSIYSLTTDGVGQRSKVHIYNGSSILLTETSIYGTSVRERRITGAGSSIERATQPFKAHINISMDQVADMRMVSMQHRDGLILIAVAKNGRITLVPVTT